MTTGDSGRLTFRDYGPILLFGLITFGGMIFIWTSKLLGWPTWLVTAVPLVLMLTYFAVSFALAGFRLHSEQAGDNLYYMGFLFTLSSLGVSLYLFAGETSIETIVRNFGIAVTSTIMGVTLRILFNQMRRDPIDIERSVRHELAEMTRRVRSEMDLSSREFSNYRRTSNQMLAEGFEEIGRQAEKNGEEIRKVMEVLATEAIKPIREAAQTFSSIIDQHNKSVDERAGDAAAKLTATTAQLSAIIDRFGETVAAVSQRLGEIRPTEDVIRVELTPAISAIRDMTEAHLKRMEAGIADGEAQADRTKAALQPLEAMEAKLDRIAALLDRPIEPRVRESAAPVPLSSVDAPVIVPLVGEEKVSGEFAAFEAPSEPDKRKWFNW